ncbi:di-heme oxidoredictase family protein [Pyxidicoccus sp. 3LG]
MRARSIPLAGSLVGALFISAAWAVTAYRPRVPPLEVAAVAPEPGEELSGGATTVPDPGRNAFGRSLMNMQRARWPRFFMGKQVFDRNWSDPREGPVAVGPLFNAASCTTCHLKDGRGRPPQSPTEPAVTLVFQLSGPDGQEPHPLYGGQLATKAVEGTRPEGQVLVDFDEVRGEFATGELFSLLRPRYQFKDLSRGPLGDGARVSPRVSPQNFGMGLLEAIPEQALLARVDAEDRDGDGISGRPNFVEDVAERRPRLGRFGWKANQPTLHQQVAHALVADMGLTSELYPREQAHVEQGGREAPEVSRQQMDDVVLYMQLLAVPKRRNWDAPEVLRGKAVFRAIGCAACHVDAAFTTGDVPAFPELSGQRIYPYTDLLLHDMGEGLADGRPDGLASGSEWRTPPLWGIGLMRAVSFHTRFLHDGRARNLEEAILWHGGEGAAAQERYVRLAREDRAAVLAFLDSL